jgi:hypothetical protein
MLRADQGAAGQPKLASEEPTLRAIPESRSHGSGGLRLARWCFFFFFGQMENTETLAGIVRAFASQSGRPEQEVQSVLESLDKNWISSINHWALIPPVYFF